MTSSSWPIRGASAPAAAIASPVVVVAVTAGPSSARWWPTTCWVRSVAWRKLSEASRCRIVVAAACTVPSRRRTAVPVASAAASPATMPASTVRPMTTGSIALVSIHTMPKAAPSAWVRHWSRVSHHR